MQSKGGGTGTTLIKKHSSFGIDAVTGRYADGIYAATWNNQKKVEYNSDAKSVRDFFFSW
jgi:hypothetical protein